MKASFTKSLKLTIVFSFLVLCSCSKDEETTLEVKPDILTFEPGTDTQSFHIITSEAWEIICDGLDRGFGTPSSTDWFSISSIAGTGNAQITITTKESSHNNSTILHIKYGQKEKTVTLNQL